jgi:hypothetical protein
MFVLLFLLFAMAVVTLPLLLLYYLFDLFWLDLHNHLLRNNYWLRRWGSHDRGRGFFLFLFFFLGFF